MSTRRGFSIASVSMVVLLAGAWAWGLYTSSGTDDVSVGLEPTEEPEATDMPVGWVVHASETVKIKSSSAPWQMLRVLDDLQPGDSIELEPGDELSVLSFVQPGRRLFTGPANLEVRADTISIRRGERAKIFPVSDSQMALAKKWFALHPSGRPRTDFLKPKANPALRVEQPLNGALLLTRDPVFEFRGQMPRDGQLIIYLENGRRFWVQPAAENYISFPPATSFEWGQHFNWELRKHTGGRILEGSFAIATQEQAYELLVSKVPNLLETPREDLFFYGVRLELAGAQREANQMWEILGREPQ
ncbi:MAG: hypothetical protein HC848_00295 [Limnobacter sp.]|nr:hypothetical protein [Limnobacter sp.]